jgi:N-acetyl-anhydromuramyl-L-alanine amidase AmpD
MRHPWFLVSLVALVALGTVQDATAAPALPYSADYGPAVWIPASTANYTVADRTHDYPVDMIVIHDIEGSYASAINAFQNPQRAGSAHYVIGSSGQVAQMVAEKDIAWHAGNWDYNTRSIGIEHEGYAGVNGSFTSAMYNASEALIASICSRWGIPIDRGHVIGHNQVPDPNNPSLFGGSDHHWDPGPYWHWTNYINLAKAKADALPSPPRMELQPLAVGRDRSVDLSWRAARSCHLPIAGYQIFQEPAHTLIATVPGSVTTFTIGGLQNGTAYRYSVTANNSDGQNSATSNTTIAMTTPTAPATVDATAAGGSAVVSWTTPSYNGGAAITGYVVTSYLHGTATSSVRFNQLTNPQVVLNLANGQPYTFTVSAVNAAGVGSQSNQSNAVTPNASLRQPPAQDAPTSPPPRSGTQQSSPAPSPPPR